MRVLRVYHAGRDAAHRERDRALVRHGVELTLIVPSTWPGPDNMINEPFEVVQLPVRRPGDVNRHHYVDAATYAEVIARIRPDVVDLHEEPFSHVVHQLLQHTPSNLPVVSYAAQNIDKRFPPPYAQWERTALARIRGIYPCTQQAASVVVGKGFAGQVHVLPLAPPPEITPGEQTPPGPHPRLLLVGRLVPEKGIDDAVRVLAALPGATLTVVGAGPHDPTALASELGIADRLTVHPWADARTLAAHYRAADILLAPSHTTRTWVEQFGRMVVEAQAAGVVVAGYATGSLPEVVGDAGVLVDEGDRGALAAAVAGIEQRWDELRAAGFAAAATRTWDAVAAGQLKLYRSVVHHARPRPAPVTARRAHAVIGYGPPARVRGGGRPFALPVLRNDNRGTRALASLLDGRQRDPVPATATRRLKVVYLDHVARMSGGEVALARLIAALPDVDAHVILAEDGPLRAALQASGATVEVLALDPRTRDVRRDAVGGRGSIRLASSTFAYTLRVRRRLRELKPDLVHTNSLKSGYYGSVAARLAGLPVVWHLRDRLAEDYLPSRAVRLTRTAIRLLPSVVVCNSEETLRTARLAPSPRSAVVASPVVHDPYPAPDTHRKPGGPTVVGMLGRLAPWKGQDVFLRAMGDVVRDRPDVRARIIGSAMFGEDDFADELRELTTELGLSENVAFVGYTDQVERELSELDVLVHASVTPEPFGQVIVEGMAAGLAVIATAAGGPLEIITDGVDGLLVPPGDVAALARAIAMLIDDPALRDRLGDAGIRRSYDFRPEAIGTAMRAIYDDLLKIERHSPRQA